MQRKAVCAIYLGFPLTHGNYPYADNFGDLKISGYFEGVSHATE